MSKAIFRTAALLAAGVSAALAARNVQCPLDETAIAELRGGLEWYTFWIEPEIAAEYTPGVEAHAEVVVSSYETVVYLEAPKLECRFINATGRLQRVHRYGPNAAKVEAAEYLAVLKKSRTNRGNCIAIVSPEQKDRAKVEKPAGNVLPSGRLCPPGAATTEDLRHESCEFVLPALRLATYPNARLDSTALERLVDGVRTGIRREFIGDRVAVTIPKAGFGDPQVFVSVESTKYRTRGLLPMLPMPEGAWEADMFIVDIPKNNVGFLIEKVKKNQVLQLQLP